ncbi:MAG: 50S ribosomal protein L18 [Gammaproteobacteria bacterium]|nr:50S ribosomal protein L18 [Gammaproteobacteria bacterium]
MAFSRKESRLRRARRGRAKIRELAMTRLCVHRTPRHLYAQIITPSDASVLASASTLDKEVKGKVKNGGNVAAAVLVGEVIAKRATKAGITKVAFDRSGFKYHGRVKALADAAREHGLQF